MINEFEKSTKLFYSIGEVSRMFNVNTSLIRFWEKEFDIIRPKKNKKGNRLFTQADVDNFHVIFNLVKEKGYTLAGAKQQLRQHKKETLENAEVIKSLKQIRKTLLDIRQSL